MQQLQHQLLALQGIGRRGDKRIHTSLGTIEQSFPQQSFPTAAVHEFISTNRASAAATAGFISGLLRAFSETSDSNMCLWISTRRTIYPPALKAFGLDPERVIFVDTHSDYEALWAIEEALKCKGLTAVVGEVRELSFTQSRRLQLAVESSGVMGFIHRCNPRREAETNACVTRWRIMPLPSASDDGLPGVSHPRWRVQLQKVRNGRPGIWQLEWADNHFRHIPFLTTAGVNASEIPQKQKVA